jgi:hypothetical protein
MNPLTENKTNPVPNPVHHLMDSISKKNYEKIANKGLLDKLREEFDALFENFDETNIKGLSSETKKMVHFVQSRIQEWNQNRVSALQISLGMLTFSILGLTLEASQLKNNLYIFSATCPFLIGLLITSLVYFIHLTSQVACNYPFIEVAQTWRWFFLYTVPKTMTFPIFLRKNKRAIPQELFLRGLLDYSRETIKLQNDPVSELKQDIEQLYLLLVYEGYMFEFGRKATGVLRWGIGLSAIFAILGLIGFILHLLPGIDHI